MQRLRVLFVIPLAVFCGMVAVGAGSATATGAAQRPRRPRLRPPGVVAAAAGRRWSRRRLKPMAA